MRKSNNDQSSRTLFYTEWKNSHALTNKHEERSTISTARQLGPHLNGRSRQDDSEVGSQLLNGFGKFGFPILDDMTLIKDAVIKFDISKKKKLNKKK